MTAWPANGDTDWNTAQAAAFDTEHDKADGSHAGVNATSVTTTGAGAITSGGKVIVGSFLNFGAIVELTISSGAVTATQTWHEIDTEGDISPDNLANINGGSEGDLLIIKPANSGRTVVVVQTGNIVLSSAGNFSMTVGTDRLTLLYDGVNWVETARSDAE